MEKHLTSSQVWVQATNSSQGARNSSRRLHSSPSCRYSECRLRRRKIFVLQRCSRRWKSRTSTNESTLIAIASHNEDKSDHSRLLARSHNHTRRWYGSYRNEEERYPEPVFPNQYSDESERSLWTNIAAVLATCSNLNLPAAPSNLLVASPKS